MASQKIQIDIGSSFNGAGMNKALGSVNTLANTAKKTAGAVGQLAGAFDGLGGTASKAVNAVAGGLGAIATGGVFGAIIFAVTTIVGLFQKMGEDNGMEKLKKNIDGIKESTEKVSSSTNTAIGKIDKYTAAIDKLTAAQLRLANAEAKAKKNALDESVEAMPDGTDEEQAAKIIRQAAVDKTKVQIDADSAKGAADAKVQGADNKLKALGDKLKLLDDSLAKLGENLTSYDHEIAKAQQKLYARQERKAGKDEIDAAKEELKAAVKARNEFVAKTYNPAVQAKNDVQNEIKTATVERQAAEQERANVIADNTKKLKVAEAAYRGSLVQAANVRERETIEAEQLMAEQEARAASIQALDEREQELEAATKELADAEQLYAWKLKDARNALKAFETIQAGGVWNPNGAQIGGRINGRQGASANNTDNAGFGDFAKPKGWEERWAQSHADYAAANGIVTGMSKKDQREYNNLANKMVEGGRGALSKSEQKRWDELRKKDPEYQAQLAERNAEKAKGKRDDLKTKVSELKTSVDAIKTYLENLGLK